MAMQEEEAGVLCEWMPEFAEEVVRRLVRALDYFDKSNADGGRDSKLQSLYLMQWRHTTSLFFQQLSEDLFENSCLPQVLALLSRPSLLDTVKYVGALLSAASWANPALTLQKALPQAFAALLSRERARAEAALPDGAALVADSHLASDPAHGRCAAAVRASAGPCAAPHVHARRGRGHAGLGQAAAQSALRAARHLSPRVAQPAARRVEVRRGARGAVGDVGVAAAAAARRVAHRCCEPVVARAERGRVRGGGRAGRGHARQGRGHPPGR